MGCNIEADDESSDQDVDADSNEDEDLSFRTESGLHPQTDQELIQEEYT